MNAMVTVKFRFDSVCNEEDLQNMTFVEMVKYLINEEGICGVVDTVNYEIINVEQIKE